jgi:outer membrane protein
VTLSQVVDAAMAAGPGQRISRANLAIAQAQYTQAAAGNSLGLTGNASASHQGAPYDSRLVAIGGLTQATDSVGGGIALSGPLGTNANLSASQSLTEVTPPAQKTDVSANASTVLWDGYPGGSALASVQKAALSLRSTEAAESANRRNIVTQVKQAYYSLLSQQRQIEILRQTLAQRQEELAKSEALFGANAATQIDLKQAQVNKMQAEMDLSLAIGTREIDREKLSALVGWPVEREYQVAEEKDTPVPSLDVIESVRSALAHRSDLLQLQLSRQSADIDLALKKGGQTPSVSVNAGFGWTRDWSKTSDYLTWSAGLKVAAPIYNAGSLEAQVRQAVMKSESYGVQQEQLAAGIATDVKNAIYALRDLLSRVDLARANMELAQSQYELAQSKFETGAATNLDVLAASVTLTTAKANLAKARGDAQLGVLALQNAMGE